MKRILSLLISCVMLLTGCTLKPNDSISSSNIETTLPIYTTIVEPETKSLTENATEAISSVYEETSDLQFLTFDDPELLKYIEDSVYAELVEQLNSDDYFVENVQAVCMPKEYYEEVGFNSQENIYFGYKVSELNEIFQGTKYIFTVDDNGNTVVQEMEVLYDDTYNQVMKNVAIGAAVILVCVTVSIVTGGVGLPAVSAVFAASAETATSFALDCAVIGGAAAAISKGIETRNPKETFKSAALGASDGFKWGAIVGSIEGGATEAWALKGATLNGLKMGEAAKIQKESGWGLDIIKNLHSVEEYNIYQEVGLQPFKINNQTALIQKIDMNLVDKEGRTNAKRILEDLSPIDNTGISIELHHVGQAENSPLAILTKKQHIQDGHNNILHWKEGASEVEHGTAWNNTVKDFWKGYLKLVEQGVIR